MGVCQGGSTLLVLFLVFAFEVKCKDMQSDLNSSESGSRGGDEGQSVDGQCVFHLHQWMR